MITQSKSWNLQNSHFSALRLLTQGTLILVQTVPVCRNELSVLKQNTSGPSAHHLYAVIRKQEHAVSNLPMYQVTTVRSSYKTEASWNSLNNLFMLTCVPHHFHSVFTVHDRFYFFISILYSPACIVGIKTVKAGYDKHDQIWDLPTVQFKAIYFQEAEESNCMYMWSKSDPSSPGSCTSVQLLQFWAVHCLNGSVSVSTNTQTGCK